MKPVLLGRFIKIGLAFWAGYFQLALSFWQAKRLLAAGAFQINVGFPVAYPVKNIFKGFCNFAEKRPKNFHELGVFSNPAFYIAGIVTENVNQEKYIRQIVQHGDSGNKSADTDDYRYRQKLNG